MYVRANMRDFSYNAAITHQKRSNVRQHMP
jgi:hypothetical protein